MATRIIASGPELQVNLAPGQDSNQSAPDIATLSDGRYLVAFVDQTAFDTDIGGQFINANGSLAGGSLVLGGALPAIEGDAGNQNSPAVAQRPGGSAVVVWRDQTAAAGDIQLAVLNSSGANTTAGTELNVITGTTGAAQPQLNPDVATLSDGRSIVVWQHEVSGSNHDIYMRFLDAAGTGFTTVDSRAVNTSSSFQAKPAVAASGSDALIVFESDALGNSDIVARYYFGASNLLVVLSVPFADHANALIEPDVAALPDNRWAIVYTDGSHIFGKIVDFFTGGDIFLGAEIQIDQQSTLGVLDPKVTATLDGGFIVTWEGIVNFTELFEIHQRRFDAHGVAYGDEFIVNTLRDANQAFPVVATSGVNVFTAWQDSGSAGRADTTPTGIRGQAATITAFDYDSARFGDFDNNGRADILFENEETGGLVIWRTDSSGALTSVNSIGMVPSGFHVEGTGNFNSTGGDDILLRSPTQVAVLPMAGTDPQPLQVLGNTASEWLNSGNGDLTGDGQSDLLFRHVSNGQIASWGVANNTLSVPPQVLGSTAPQFRIVAVDDFTGDNQADILFRDETNGEIAIWRVANNGLTGVPAVVGSTSQAYHVVTTGDFDGNGSNDILFRNDNGDIAMWLLNSSGQLLGAPQAIGSTTLDFHVESSGDLNGDGRSDIVFRNANGTVVEWLMNGASFAAPPAVLGTIQVDHAIAAHHFDLV